MSGDRLSPGTGRQGQGDNLTTDVPGDIGIYGRAVLLTETILRHARKGSLSLGTETVGRNGRIIWRFVTFPHATPKRSRLDELVAWMRETRKLGRTEAQRECAAAGTSAKLHDKALKVLAGEGEIVKEGKYWVWADSLIH